MRRTRLRRTKKYSPTPHYQAQLATSGQKVYFFRDALHLAHPCRSSTFFGQNRARKVTSRWYITVQNSSRMKFPSSPYINFKKENSYDTDWKIFLRPIFPRAQDYVCPAELGPIRAPFWPNQLCRPGGPFRASPSLDR